MCNQTEVLFRLCVGIGFSTHHCSLVLCFVWLIGKGFDTIISL
ncbi:hypothetical protein LINPERPRIM_LOCUS24878, partial [Linum perenne]